MQITIESAVNRQQTTAFVFTFIFDDHASVSALIRVHWSSLCCYDAGNSIEGKGSTIFQV